MARLPEVRFAARQSQGARAYQEDYFGVRQRLDPDDDHTVCVLADGIGGQAHGGTASKLAVDAALVSYRAATGSVSVRLRQALDAANASIADAVATDAGLQGTGCTLVCAVITAAGVEWLSVGDSPLWLYRDRRLRRLNADHSMVPVFAALVAEGMMTDEEARTDAKRHVLRSALMGEAIRLVDASPQPLTLQHGDHLLLASDGLLSLAEDRIADVLAANATVGPDQAAGALLDAVEALRVPNQDNTTVVVVAPEPAPKET